MQRAVYLLLATSALGIGCGPRRGPSAPVAPAKVDPGCGDVRRYREIALSLAQDPATKAAIERWDPPAPVPAADRPAIVSVARAYVAACGLEETVKLAGALISFPTVGAEAPAPDHPAFIAMADYLRHWATQNDLGFSVYGAHDVWELSLGEGPERLGFVMHADVVPAHEAPPEDEAAGTSTPAFSNTTDHPPDWTYPPFDARVAGGRLHGRGAEDDKGPIAAVLVVMKTLRAMGLLPGGRVLAILGTGEESDWTGMRRYVEARQAPEHVISVDANFPVVIAESGFVAWTLAIPRTAGERGAPSSLGPKVIDARAGQFLTQVPGEAAMTLIPSSRQRMEDLKNDVALAIGEVRHVLPSLTAAARIEDEGLVVTVSGQAVHSSTADEGHNALWGLAEIARRLTPAPTALAKMLDVVSLRFVGDHHGERLGLAYQHPLMGKLLVAPTILRTTDDRVTLSVNMRRPAGRSKEDFEAGLAEALHSMQQGIEPRLEEVGERFVGEPALADVSSPLVPILLDIYRRHTGTEGQPIAIRGGTYARLFRGAVSFGPSFPGRPYLGHAPNEYIELEDLDRLIQMLLEATLRLAPPLVPPTEEAVSSDHPAKEGLLDVPEWRPSGAPR